MGPTWNFVIYNRPAPPKKLKKILIVEDDGEFRKLLEAILEDGGYRVVAAPDGAAGLEAARAERPDLILMDVEMPRMDGYAAVKALRADPEIGGIPVILVTVHSKMHQVVEGLKAGADDHITKPFDPAEVLARIEGVFRQKER